VSQPPPLEAQSANYHISGVGSLPKDLTAASAEEATLLRCLAELEETARANGAKCTPEARAGICQRLRRLASEISSVGHDEVWHP
jgi:hypothetical protein